MIRAILLLVLFSITSPPALAQFPGVPGVAQEVPPESAPVSEEEQARQEAEISAFLALLRSRSVQDWLTDSAVDAQTAMALAPQDPDDREMGGLGGWLAMGHDRFDHFRASLTALPGELQTAQIILTLELGAKGLLQPVLIALGLIALGALVEAIVRWRLGKRFGRHMGPGLQELEEVGTPRTVLGLGTRIGMRLIGLLAFALVSVGGFLLMTWSPILELLVFSILVAIVVTRAVTTIARLILVPRGDFPRLIPVNDRAAGALCQWVGILTAVAAGGGLICRALEDMGLLPVGGFALAHLVLAAFILVLGIAMIVQGRDLQTLCGQCMGKFGPILAPAAVSLALVWLAIVWVLALFGFQSLLITWLGISAIFFGDQAILPILRQSTRLSSEEDSPYLPIWRRLARLALALFVAVPVLDAWGIDLFALADSRMGGSALASAAFDILLTLLLADLVWQTARIAIKRRLDKGATAEEADSGGEGGGGAGPDARARTLLPLFGKVLGGVLLVMTTMIVLSSLGVDIGPLLAGAGVVGIAIGFGAQALVRDIVSGIFFLIDDAFRVGEYIENGDLRGTVEAISLRSMKLRHHRGHIHTVPFGELRSLTNYSRDWVIMKLEFRVPFETDLGLVKRLVKQVGKEIQADPTLGPGLLEPVKSQGVRRVEEFNMVVGVKFMAKPGAQWLIRRDVYQKILAIFDANGIHLASRDVNVNVRQNASEEEIHQAVTGAAQAAVDAQAPSGP